MRCSEATQQTHKQATKQTNKQPLSQTTKHTKKEINKQRNDYKQSSLPSQINRALTHLGLDDVSDLLFFFFLHQFH